MSQSIGALIKAGNKDINKGIDKLTQAIISIENFGGSERSLESIHGKVIIASKELHKWVKDHNL